MNFWTSIPSIMFNSMNGSDYPFDKLFSLPVSSIFIAANFALAGIIHYKDVIECYSNKIKMFLITMTLIPSICSIVCSKWFSWLWMPHSYHVYLILISLFCLITIYVVILFFCIFEQTNFYIKYKLEKKRMSDMMNNN